MPFLTKVRSPARKFVEAHASQIRFKYHLTHSEYKKYEWLSDRDQHVMVVEDPPKEVPIRFFSIAGDTGKPVRFMLRKPWSYMLVFFSSQGIYLGSVIFFALEKLKNDKSRGLRLVPLPNIGYSRGIYVGCCLGDINFPKDTSMQKDAIRAHDSFWTSTFNYELHLPYMAIPKEVIRRSKPYMEERLKKICELSYRKIAWVRAPSFFPSIEKAVGTFSHRFWEDY